jgi:pSer/pThr/pTyr-binding forkhead associated (FHA) protein
MLVKVIPSSTVASREFLGAPGDAVAMDVRLVVKQGPTRLRSIKLRSAETLVGRQKGCDLRIPSAEISRRHCILSFADGTLTVEDLNSANGTFVNDQQVLGKQTVKPGDQLKIGPMIFGIDYDAEDSLAKTPKQLALPAAIANEPEPAFELIDDEPPTVKPAQTTKEEDEKIELIFDDAEPINLPEGQDLRDVLGQMER